MLAASFLDKMLWKNSMSLISTSNYITIELLEIWHDRWNIFTLLGPDRFFFEQWLLNNAVINVF